MGTETEVEKKVDDDDVKQGQDWIHGQENPDHLLARVNAANEGFVSGLNSRFGSFLIYSLFEKYNEALDKGQSPFIHEVFDAIQTELQKKGKQMPESVWNDGTRYMTLSLKKNKGLGRTSVASGVEKKKKNSVIADTAATDTSVEMTI